MLNQEEKIVEILSQLNTIQTKFSDEQIANILENIKKELNCLV
jgi:DNA-binding TFAR19-related protein (PDSD5 family)